MAEIFLDGEAVRIDGPIPRSLQNLLGLIEHSLAASGRVLAAVAIDGRAVEPTISDPEYAAARRIDIASLSMGEAITQVAAACAHKASAMRAAAEETCHGVLREPWGEVAPKLAALGASLGELLQEIGSLATVPGHAARAERFSAELSRWLDAVAARDAAAVCLSFDVELLPRLDDIAALGAPTGEADAQ